MALRSLPCGSAGVRSHPPEVAGLTSNQGEDGRQPVGVSSLSLSLSLSQINTQILKIKKKNIIKYMLPAFFAVYDLFNFMVSVVTLFSLFFIVIFKCYTTYI